MKYNDLDSKQKSNYWALTYLLDILREELGDENPLTNNLFDCIALLEKNLGLELYTDCAFLTECSKFNNPFNKEETNV